MTKLEDWQRAALADLRTKAMGKQNTPDRDVWAAIMTLTNAIMAMAEENHPNRVSVDGSLSSVR